MVQFQRCVGLAMAIGAGFGLLGACGGGGGSKVGGSYASIANAIESPSGTVDESSAVGVGEEFEKLSATGNLAGGMRRDAQVAQSQSGSLDCPSGGSISFTGSGNESSGHATGSYDSCCYAAGCCMDGTADIYYSSESSAYTYCGSYDLNYSCEGVTADLAFNGCFGSTGEWVYVVEVGGETYSVSGTYQDGNGTLEITGENGTWTCTYTNDSGSCSGTGGDSFSF